MKGETQEQQCDSTPSKWTLLNWIALWNIQDGIRENVMLKIWNEGVPNDIASFKNQRVVLVVPNGYGGMFVSTNMCRIFGPIKASVRVADGGRMSTEEVTGLLNQMRNAGEDEIKASLSFLEGHGTGSRVRAEFNFNQ